MTENIILSPVPDLYDLAASATWSVRYLDPSGFECLLSLESASGVEVLHKAQAAITRLNESGCTPLNKLSLTSAKDEPAKGETHICPIHNVPMRDGRKTGAHGTPTNWRMALGAREESRDQHHTHIEGA